MSEMSFHTFLLILVSLCRPFSVVTSPTLWNLVMFNHCFFLCFVILLFYFFIMSPVLFAYIITMRCLCVTVCRVSIDASCAHTPHTLTFHVLSCCCRCFLTVCLSLIFSFCSVGHQMLQGATMQQLQQVQVQSQGTPITVNTHARIYCH